MVWKPMTHKESKIWHRKRRNRHLHHSCLHQRREPTKTVMKNSRADVWQLIASNVPTQDMGTLMGHCQRSSPAAFSNRCHCRQQKQSNVCNRHRQCILVGWPRHTDSQVTVRWIRKTHGMGQSIFIPALYHLLKEKSSYAVCVLVKGSLRYVNISATILQEGEKRPWKDWVWN